MARPLRIEFPGAIYHVISRGNARQRIFRDDSDYERFLQGLESVVVACAWEMLAFVLMPNHTHLFFRTLEANLSRGMQRLLSGYANWFAKRHRRPGHLLQGRFKGELVEDDSYFWAVSRYIHLNPVRGKRPLVSRPEDWPWSSYPGFCRERDKRSWVAYERTLDAWHGQYGGADPVSAYQRYVEEGLNNPPSNPFAQAKFGWILGSDAFVERIRKQLKQPAQENEVPQIRPLITLDLDLVIDTVASFYGVSEATFRTRGNPHVSRAIVAWLARRHSMVSRRELADHLGLSRAESVGNLVRRVDHQIEENAQLRRELADLETTLLQLRTA